MNKKKIRDNSKFSINIIMKVLELDGNSGIAAAIPQKY